MLDSLAARFMPNRKLETDEELRQRVERVSRQIEEFLREQEAERRKALDSLRLTTSVCFIRGNGAHGFC